MKIDFINCENTNTRLILLFTGWSTGPEIATDIRLSGWDVVVVHDLTELSLDTKFLDRYYTIYLFAWSLGVYAAARLLPADRITAAFAINGTERPVDDLHGIPYSIFKGTADGLDSRNLQKFRLRMTGDRETYERLWPVFRTHDERTPIMNLSLQLHTVMKDFNGIKSKTPDFSSQLPWIRAFVSTNDRIFPPENQLTFWGNYPDVEILESKDPHYIDFNRIISLAISDPVKVSTRFSKASGSYDTNAIAQYAAAIKLADLLKECNPPTGGKILEIGCGTGLFTREYARFLKPMEATFVDITEVGPFGIAPTEYYFTEDAEEWIEKQTGKWDIILSASAIQWFADLPRFLKQCNRILKPGGLIILSSFLPGNMEELDGLRPSPIHYHKADKLKEWMQHYFSDTEILDDCIKVEFQSVREMLMHLKHTGVAGSAPGSGLSIKKMSHLRSLTYRPVYIKGRKPTGSQAD